MSDVYLIEVNGRAVGLVARDRENEAYRFHAAEAAMFVLDGRMFRTPTEAQDAAARALKEARRRPMLDHAA